MSAVEEWGRHLSHGIRLSERNIIEHAEAAIAELENSLMASAAMSADAWRQVRIARDRADKAEAHADAADAEHQRREDVLHEKLRQAEAEVERLRERLEKTIIKSWRWEYAATHDLIDGEVWARPKSVLKRILATYSEERA